MAANFTKTAEPRFVPMLQKGTVRAGTHCSDGWTVNSSWHIHDAHQLLYAVEGSVEVEDPQARYVVPSQFAIWIPAGTPHRTVIQRIRSGSVFLSPELVAPTYRSARVILAPRLMREMILHAMRWPLERAEDAVSRVFFECFSQLCEQWLLKDVRLVLPSTTDPRIAAAMTATRADIATVTLREACRAAALSERSLRRYFREGIGMSWEAYRLRLRIALALEALDSTQKPVAQIAAEVGYEDAAAFGRAFRSLMGVSPMAYRRGER